MENNSSDEEEINMKNLHFSVNLFHNNTDLSLEEEKNYRKRSSSMSLNPPKNFVPKLKPIKAIICPSPINLNQKSPPPISEKNNDKEILSSSSGQKKEYNLKPIKFIFTRKNKHKKSTKFLNIEEETHETEAISDCEDKSRKVTLIDSDSDSSKSDFENNNSKYNKNGIINNINIIREKMIIIRKNCIRFENIYDDSNIGNSYAHKRLYQYQNIYQQKIIDKLRKNKNMNLNPLKPIKNRTKSFNMKPRYVSTILGFLEKNNSTNSLNSNEK